MAPLIVRVVGRLRNLAGDLPGWLSAIRYAHPVRFWGGVVLVVVAVVTPAAAAAVPALLAAGVTVVAAPAVDPSAVDGGEVATVLPGSRALPGSNDPRKNARVCDDAAQELRGIATDQPVYRSLNARQRARTEVLVSTVGEVCTPGPARRSSDELRGWLTGKRYIPHR